MNNILVILCCIVAACSAIPLTDSTQEVVYTSKFDTNGPQPVDEVIAIESNGDENPSKRVARHYGFGGVGIGIGVAVPVAVPSMFATLYQYFQNVKNMLPLRTFVL